MSDFGLAKRGGDSQLTATGTTVGTPSYMAPEQANGRRDLGHAADIYSLGALLYECLTARPPFLGTDAVDTLLQVRMIDPVPPSRFQPRVPADLETICLKCLAKDPLRRYATANDLADDLGRWLAGEPIRARPAGPVERFVKAVRRRPVLAATVTSTALALIFGAVVSTYFAVRATERAAAAERAERSKRLKLAESHLDRGLALAHAGEIAAGLHWMVEALREVRGDGATELERTARVNLAEWGRLIHAPRDRLEVPNAIAFALSADGRWLAVGDRHGTVEIWDFVGRRKLGVRLEHLADTDISAIAFRPDGRQLAVAHHSCEFGQADENAVQLWDATTWARSHRLRLADRYAPVRLSYHPAGRELAVGYRRELPRVWDALTGELRLTVPRPESPGERGEIRSTVAFAPDGNSLLCATGSINELDGGQAWQCSAATGAMLGEPIRSDRASLSIAPFAPDGRTFAVLAFRESLRLFEASSGRELARVVAAGDSNTTAFSPDGRRLLVTQGDNIVVLDGQSLRPVGELLTHRDKIRAYSWTPDGDSSLTLSDDGILTEWDMARPLSRPTGVRPRLNASATAVLADKDVRNPIAAIDARTGTALGTIQAAGPNGAVAHTRFQDAESGRPVAPPVVHGRFRVDGLALSADGRIGATSASRHGVGGEVQLFDARTGRELGPPIPQSNCAAALAVRPDGKQLAVGNFHEVLQLYAVPDARPLGRFIRLSDIGLGIAYSPDGSRLAVGTDRERHHNPEVVLWSATDKPEPVGRRMAHRTGVRQVVFSPDGRRLATSSVQNVRLWDGATGEPISDWLIHSSGCGHIAFSPDGRILACPGLDGKIRLWDGETGHALRAGVLDHPAAVLAVGFTPDGRTLIAGCADGTAQAWDVATRKRLGPPWQHPSPVDYVAGRADGRAAVTLDLNGTGRAWPLPTAAGDESLEVLKLRVEVMTGLTMDEEQVVTALTMPAWRQRHGQLQSHDGGRVKPLAVALSDAEWHHRQARDAEDDGHDFSALWHLERLDRLRPGDAWTAARVGRIHAAAGDSAAADEAYGRASATAEERAVWHRQAAAAAAAERRFELALWHLDRALRVQPDEPALAAERARVLARLGQWGASVAEWSRALAGRPEQWIWKLERADAREQLGDANGALADRTAAVLDGGGLEDAIPLIERAEKAGEWADVLRLTEAITERGPVPLSLFELTAVRAVRLGDAAAYRRACDRVRLPRPTDPPEIVHLLASVRTCGAGAVSDWGQVLAAFDAVLTDPRRDGGVRGALLYRAGRYAEALAAFDAAGDALDGDGRIFRAMALAKLGRADEARRELQAARERPAETGIAASRRELLLREAEVAVDG